jgi:hypothetical protein
VHCTGRRPETRELQKRAGSGLKGTSHACRCKRTCHSPSTLNSEPSQLIQPEVPFPCGALFARYMQLKFNSRVFTILLVVLTFVPRPAAEQTYFFCPRGCNSENAYGRCEVRSNTCKLNKVHASTYSRFEPAEPRLNIRTSLYSQMHPCPHHRPTARARARLVVQE